MVELVAKSVSDQVAGQHLEGVDLRIVNVRCVTSVMPYRGQDELVSNALLKAYGVELPKPNRMIQNGSVCALWFSRRQTLLIGATPDSELAKYAALVDQSDAWAVIELEGPRVWDVLCRLVPIDLRTSQFKQNHTARTQLIHMMVSITRVDDSCFQIIGCRSMAGSLIHHVSRAMSAVVMSL